MSYLPLIRRASLGMCALLATASAAQATTNNYGDLIGPNVMYLGVTEVTSQNTNGTPSMPATLFGTPSVSGGPQTSTLIFDQTSFSAQSGNGGFQFTDGQLNTTIMANPGLFINGLGISEFGSYTLFGGTPGGTKATISIDAIQAKVTFVNGIDVPDVVLPKTIVYTNGGSAPSNNVGGGITFLGGGSNVNQPWTATVTFNLASVPGATKIELALDNTLLATSELNSFAFIDKKSFGITTTTVPEPSTIALGLLGGVGLLIAGRRCRKQASV